MAEHGGVLFCGGGTGGHVHPGLAVAAHLADRPRSWIGDPERIEAKLVPGAGIPLLPFGLRRPRIHDPRWWLHAAATGWRCFRHLVERRPGAVVALGGYASLVPGLLAPLLGRPLIVFEQNAHPGRTNRLLARRASLVVTQFDQAHPRLGRRCLRLGNPIRVIGPDERGGAKRLRVLVVGGSLAAKSLNDLVALAAPRLKEHGGIEIIHLAGDQDRGRIEGIYQAAGLPHEVHGYWSDMPGLYRRIDVAVTRAGATTVAELCAAGIPALYIPLPWAAEDHQTANAQAVATWGGAEVMAQGEATPEKVAGWLCALADDRTRVRTMAAAALGPARPHAARVCAGIVRHLAARRARHAAGRAAVRSGVRAWT